MRADHPVITFNSLLSLLLQHMKTGLLIVVLASLLVLQAFLSHGLTFSAKAVSVPDVFVGVDIGYGDSVAEAKKRIDEAGPILPPLPKGGGGGF